MLLARFFKVHPGYLVDDPEGFQNELISDLGALEDKLDLWLVERRGTVPPGAGVASCAARHRRHADSRVCLVLLGDILENPGLADRLMEVLKPETPRQEAPVKTGGVYELGRILSGVFLRWDSA